MSTSEPGLLGGLPADQATRVIIDSMGRQALPYLRDPQVRIRAIETATKQGLLDRIEKDLAWDKPIPVLPFSRYREFRRTGNRSHYEGLCFARSAQIDRAAMACFLGLDRLGYLQDLLWADCEATWWELPAHEGAGASGKPRTIDLFVAIKGAQLATILRLLEDRIEPEVRDRVIREIRRRVIEEFFNPIAELGWKTRTNNWNAVCHGAVGIAALLLETEPQRLANLVTQTLANLPAFLEGFTEDGGCTEGPGYWQFGFGWYVELACTLYDFTGGRINIMADAKVERICRYPLAASVRPGQALPFADTEQSFLSVSLATCVNRFHRVPELYGLCRLTSDGSPVVESLADLLLYDGRKHAPPESSPDSHLPALAVARVCSGGVTVGAKAGHNAEHHNHNDVGSFIVHKARTYFLTDPGAPVYSARTFSASRYDSVFCNSLGHSVPVVNGQLQSQGISYAGTIRVDGLNGPGPKVIRIEMAGAYNVPSLKRLDRVIQLVPGGSVSLTDTVEFASQPVSLEEAFITTLPARVSDDGRAVSLHSEADGVGWLRAVGTDGTFQVAELTEESRESRAGELLRRITFRPARLDWEITLQFEMSFAQRGQP